MEGGRVLARSARSPPDAPHALARFAGSRGRGAARSFPRRRPAARGGHTRNASPEESDGACYTDTPGLSVRARTNRTTLSRALTTTGLINYPTEWWHWSLGDRYWALQTQQSAALYGPVELP
ncbi:M15 family metallopeptidase [Streptomyces sp. HPF1205]|uniref:M15 family metallopeptidase n=1 Tax=Streptomyces sp. HPF1205 TaxID=2873262 RepID=UPI0035ABF964